MNTKFYKWKVINRWESWSMLRPEKGEQKWRELIWGVDSPLCHLNLPVRGWSNCHFTLGGQWHFSWFTPLFHFFIQIHHCSCLLCPILLWLLQLYAPPIRSGCSCRSDWSFETVIRILSFLGRVFQSHIVFSLWIWECPKTRWTFQCISRKRKAKTMSLLHPNSRHRRGTWNLTSGGWVAHTL